MILGMSASKVARKGLLGFAIRRTDETEGERYWLRGMKTFHEVVPFQQPGLSYSLLEHPIQTFRWADYTAKLGHNYIYEILPMRGTPKFLTEGEVVEVAISTESEGDLGEAHDVYFNRGVAASQAYSRRFGNQKPSMMPDGQAKSAYKWLSRGLEEALIRFIEVRETTTMRYAPPSMSLITIRYSRRSNRQRTTARTSKSFTTQDESIHRLQPFKPSRGREFSPCVARDKLERQSHTTSLSFSCEMGIRLQYGLDRPISRKAGCTDSQTWAISCGMRLLLKVIWNTGCSSNKILVMRLFDSGFKTIQSIHQVPRHLAQPLYLALGRGSESSSGTPNDSVKPSAALK